MPTITNPLRGGTGARVVPSKRRRADESEQMRLKLAKFKGEVVPKPGCRLRGDCIEMQCVKCRAWKERTTEYFTKSKGGKNFTTCDPGHETLHNSMSHPCNTCFASMSAVYNSTPDGYIRTLCSNYENITPKDVWEKYKELKGVSPITGVAMVLEPIAEHRVSIHNLGNTDKGHSNWATPTEATQTGRWTSLSSM